MNNSVSHPIVYFSTLAMYNRTMLNKFVHSKATHFFTHSPGNNTTQIVFRALHTLQSRSMKLLATSVEYNTKRVRSTTKTS